MGTQAQPEPVDSQQAPTQNPPETPIENAAQVSQTTSTPKQEEAQQPNKLLELMEANMREQASRLRQLESENNQLRTTRQTEELNPPIQAGQASEDFWRDPSANIQKLIREETQRAVKPLYDFKNQMEKQTGYDGLKSRFKTDPRYAEIFPKIEGMVDTMMQGAEPNEQNMQLAVLSAIGSVVTGQVKGVTLTPAATPNGQPSIQQQQAQGQPTDTRVITPAHLRSSPVQLQQETQKPAARDLTELEERLRKERGQTKEEYLSWLDLPATDVATSKIGKPEKPVDNPASQVQRNVNPQGARA